MTRVILGRKVVYSLLTTAVLLLALEGLARIIEPRVFPYQRSLPTPSPAAEGVGELREEIERLVRDDPPPPRRTVRRDAGVPLVRDDAARWVLPPNTDLHVDGVTYRINEWGMRGLSPPPVEPGPTRILTLGDSSIFGQEMDVSDVFSGVAATHLSEAWDREVTTVIGAVPGHDTRDSLAVLTRYGPQVEPTWVLVGNMWSDIYRGSVEETASGRAYLPPRQTALRRLALYRMLWRIASPWLRTTRVRWITSRDDVGGMGSTGATWISLPEYIDNLREIARTSGELEARVVFVMLPAPMDFDPVPPPETVREFRAAMRAVASEIDAPLVDGPALFRSRSADITYFGDQVHPNHQGHELLGLGLVEVLEPIGPPPNGLSHYAEVSHAGRDQPPETHHGR